MEQEREECYGNNALSLSSVQPLCFLQPPLSHCSSPTSCTPYHFVGPVVEASHAPRHIPSHFEACGQRQLSGAHVVEHILQGFTGEVAHHDGGEAGALLTRDTCEPGGGGDWRGRGQVLG